MNKNEYVKMFSLENKHFWFLAKRSFADVFINPIQGSVSKILDVGCGTGGMTQHLSKYGVVEGIDSDISAVKYSLKRKIKVRLGDANKTSGIKDKYDLVTLFDVLYHKNIPDPKKVVKNVAAIIKKGGYILVTDSAMSCLYSSHDLHLGGVRRFSSLEMRTMLEQSGFQVIRISYIYFFIFPLVFLRRVVLDKFVAKGSDVEEVIPAINILLLFLLRIEAYILKWFDFPWGSSIIALAKKK